jgi:AraC-like DNA-binding protein
MTTEQSWSTAQAAPGAEYRFWKEALCEAVFELDLTLPDSAGMSGSIRQRPLDLIPVSLIELNCLQTVWRTPAAIARSTKQQLEFVTLQHGRASLSHAGGEVQLEAGDSILIDGQRPYGFSTTDLRSLSFHLPTEWLKRWIPQPEQLTGIPLRGRTPWGHAVSAVIGATPWQAIGDDGDHALQADQLAKLLSLALTAPPTCTADSAPQRTFTLALQMLRQHAHDHALNAGELAHLLRISPRYLHKLFAGNGTTYGRELQNERLALAARMLSDRKFDGLPVAEIAWRAGFSDTSHFSRRFKTWKGVPPAQFRFNDGTRR